ncbi:MAG: hypothetical protein LBC03_03610 [Nitrososphaerota archaeon]|jgi:Fe-S cluster biosynthesis and repair protein YggX|nr:hypothetical protein [Nitrososphaerota archaeon]
MSTSPFSVTENPPQITSDIQHIIDKDRPSTPKIALQTPEEIEQHRINIAVSKILSSENIKEDFIKLFITKEIAYEDYNLAEFILHTMLSAYTNEPMNVRVKAPSSSGKTYVVTKIASLFPKEDIILLNKASPQSWLYDYAIKKDKDGNIINEADKPHKPTYQEIENYLLMYGNRENTQKNIKIAREELSNTFPDRMKEWEQRQAEGYLEINLKNKIIILVEASNAAINVIKPLLSHDSLDGVYRTLNPDTKKNMNIRFNAYPAFIINDAEKNYGEEIETRFLIVQPVASIAKYDKAQRISLNSISDVLAKKEITFTKKTIVESIRCIRNSRTEENIIIILPFLVELKNNGNSENSDDLISSFSSKNPRDMRDFNKYLELSRAMGILNIFHTPLIDIAGDWYQLVSIPECIEAKKMFDKTLELTKTRLSNDVLNFFKTTVQNNNACSITQLYEAYNKNKIVKTSRSTIRDWVNKLESIGFVEKRDNSLTGNETTIISLISKNGDLADYGINTMTENGKQKYNELLKESFNFWWVKYEKMINSAKLLNVDDLESPLTLEDVKRFVLTGKLGDLESMTESLTEQVKCDVNAYKENVSTENNINDKDTVIDFIKDRKTQNSEIFDGSLTEMQIRQTFVEYNSLTEYSNTNNTTDNVDLGKVCKTKCLTEGTLYRDKKNSNSGQTTLYFRFLPPSQTQQCSCRALQAHLSIITEKNEESFLCRNCYNEALEAGQCFKPINQKPN